MTGPSKSACKRLECAGSTAQALTQLASYGSQASDSAAPDGGQAVDEAAPEDDPAQEIALQHQALDSPAAETQHAPQLDAVHSKTEPPDGAASAMEPGLQPPGVGDDDSHQQSWQSQEEGTHSPTSPSTATAFGPSLTAGCSAPAPTATTAPGSTAADLPEASWVAAGDVLQLLLSLSQKQQQHQTHPGPVNPHQKCVPSSTGWRRSSRWVARLLSQRGG